MTQSTISGVKAYRALTVAIVAILALAASASLRAQTYTDLHDFNVTGDPL